MKTAIVTGSTRGIGRAIGIALLHQGYRVAFHYRRDTVQAHALAQKLEENGFSGRYQIVQADLSALAGLDELEAALGPTFQTLDYLVLNVATTRRGRLEQLCPEDWEEVLRTNLTVPLFLAQRCAPRMRPGGCVLFLGAVMGQYPHAMSLPYGASKAAIHYLTRALVKEFEGAGVRVNCVAPGFVETDWQRDKPEEIRRSIESKVALHRFAQPEEVAQLACAVLENPYMNGSIVNIDGGYCYQ